MLSWMDSSSYANVVASHWSPPQWWAWLVIKFGRTLITSGTLAGIVAQGPGT
jgi:hypothetical protein